MGFAISYDSPPSGGEREPSPTKHPPLITHPPTNPPLQQYNSSGAGRTDQSTTAAQQYGGTHHSGTPAVRLKLGGIYLHFLTILHLPGESASRHPPSTHHSPRTHRPIHHHSSTTAVEQDVPTNPQRQHTAVWHYAPQRYTCGKPGAGWDLHFLTILHLPGKSASRHPSTHHPPPTTHPPTNPPPQQYNSSGAVHTDQSTMAAQ